MAARAAGVAAARGRRRRASASRGCAALAAHLGAPPTRPTSRGARAGSAPSATSPSCSTATRCTGPRCCAWRGWHDGRRRPRRRRLAGRAVAAAARRASAAPGPAERLEAACARLRGRAGARRPARSASSLFGLTRLPAGHLAGPARARRRAATSTCSCCTRRPRCGSAIAKATGDRRCVRRATTRPPTLPANRLLASWGHDARELQLVARRGGEHVDHHHPVEHADRHAARRASRPTCAPTARRRARRSRTQPTRARCSTPTTAASQVHACHGRARQVEVRARRDPARARRTTRRSSRATSSSCARTSRRSRR